MDKKLGLLIVFIFSFTGMWGQSQLLPSIGLTGLPLDTDSVCSIPVYTGTFDNTGFQNGEPVPDFTLHKSNGDPVSLGNILAGGKPVLLVGASYTCPVFRGRLSELNRLVNDYSNNVSIYLVYTVEAHPDIDVSPYSGTVWTHAANTQSGILYRQPTTYGERKDVANDMTNQVTIQPEILIDGPCNEWWSAFGPAPNNAYLIDTSGVVYEKHGWFNRAPGDMAIAIDSLLAGAPGSGNGGPGTGNPGGFTFTLDSDPIITGKPDETLTFYGTFENVTNNGINILVKRLQNNLAQDWESALCVDVCLAPNTDETTFFLPPQSLQSFNFYFYTSSVPDSSTARIGFRNEDSTNNRTFIDVKGITSGATSISSNLDEAGIGIWPSPAKDFLYIELDHVEAYDLKLIDATGRIVRIQKGNSHLSSINVSEMPSGIYWVLVKLEGEKVYSRKVMILD